MQINISEKEYTIPSFGSFETKCGLRIRNDGENIIVIITDVGRTSATNNIEGITTHIYNTFLKDFRPMKIVWVEHYPERSNCPETWVIVDLGWKRVLYGKKHELRFYSPKWTRITNEERILELKTL